MLDRPAVRDIAGDRTLPAFAYTDPVVLAAEREAVFFRSWRYVCHASRIETPGSVLPFEFLDQSLFLARGHDGVLRGFWNVCPHRGHRLVAEAGTKARITCPYHAWTWALDGALVRAGRSRMRLEVSVPELRVGTMLDLVFVNLDANAPPLAEVYPGLAEDIAARVPGLGAYRPRAVPDYLGGAYACNWKALVDNYLECHHCETAHPSFNSMICVTGTRNHQYGTWCRQDIPFGRIEDCPYPIDPAEDTLDGYFWYMFPNTLLSVFPGVPNFAISRADPDGPENSIRGFEIHTPDGVSAEREAARAEWGMRTVNAEDRALCESVQIGMRQRGFTQGLYLADPDKPHLSEESVRMFHQLYAERMGPALAR